MVNYGGAALDWKTLSGQTARTVTDAVTNGTTTVTSATAAFSGADVGNLVIITDSADGGATAGNSFASTIAGVTNTTTATLVAAPSFSVSSANLTTGPDNKNAINTWLTAAAGEVAYAPKGIYLSSGQHTVPGATMLRGDGYDYNSVDTPPQYGTVFQYAGKLSSPSYFFQLGSTGAGGAGKNNTIMKNVAVDASNLCTSAVLVTAFRAQVIEAQAWRGSGNAVQLNGGSCWVINSVLGQQNLGDVLYCNGGDAHVMGNVLRDPGSGGACCHAVNVLDFLYVGNHSWSGGNAAVSSTYPCNNLLIDNSGAGSDIDNYVITGNLFDGVYGHAIVLNPTGGTSARISDVTISGNSFFAVSGFPDNTFYAVYLNTSSGNNVRGLGITGNAIRGVEGSTNSWAGLLGWAGAGGVSQLGIVNNTGMGVRSMWPTAIRPDGGRHGNVFTATCTSATSTASSNDGQATFSGTGSQTAFAINHGLAAAPVTAIVTPASAAASGAFSVSVSSTQITVTYGTAPANGSNNVVLNWMATQ